MAEATEIAWATSTFNIRWGCTRVSPACDNCYAASLAKRYGHDVWDNDQRRPLSEHYWTQPLRWERKAAASGEPWRVFCSSMADVFEDSPNDDLAEQMAAERSRLWSLIEATPHLTWMLLTKRPQNILRMVPEQWRFQRGDGPSYNPWPSNVWVGTTVENQRYADLRIPQLLKVQAPVRFLSCEPLLGPLPSLDLAGIQWVIVGGESGPGARPMHIGWVRDLRDAAVAADVPFFFKQWGNNRPITSLRDWTGGAFAVDYDGNTIPVSGSVGMFSEAAHVGAVVMQHERSKHSAGRLLDGREWSQFPETAR